MSEEPFSARHALHAALSRNTGYLVSRVGAFAQKRFAQRMATLGLTTRMWGVLNVLAAEQPITQQALGKAIETDPSSIVATIDQLERDGLVERHRLPLGKEPLERVVAERLARGRDRRRPLLVKHRIERCAHRLETRLARTP